MYGVDLHELWRARQGVRILDLLDGLPKACRYRRALLNDPEMAKAIVDQEEKDRAAGKTESGWAPDLAELDDEMIQLRRLEQLMEEMATLLHQQLAGKKSKRKPKQPPEPRTAVQAERDRRAAERGENIIQIFTPHARS